MQKHANGHSDKVSAHAPVLGAVEAIRVLGAIMLPFQMKLTRPFPLRQDISPQAVYLLKRLDLNPKIHHCFYKIFFWLKIKYV